MSSVFRPKALTTYVSLFGKDYRDTGMIFVDIVRAIKRARPDDRVWRAVFRIFGYPLNPSNYSMTSNVMTLEGFYQGVAIDWLIRGRITDHGAPIPIKRVIIPGKKRNYRVFASSFALMLPWRDGSLYVPFKGQYAKAEIKDGELVITDAENTVPLEFFTTDAVVLRNVIYQTIYDFYRLGLEPPKKFAGFSIEPVRGPLKNIMKRVRVVVADLVYFFVPPNLRDLGPHRKIVTKLLKLSGEESEVFEEIGGHGYHGYGVLVDYDVSPTTSLRSSPETVLFARWDDYYVNLRPIPVDAVEPDWVVWGHGNYVALRLNPPYYVPSQKVKNLVNQYLAGTVFKKIPNLIWEVR